MALHGGDVYRNRVLLDFSVNVNPLGMPRAVEAALHAAVAMCGRYPDIRAERLKRAVGGLLSVSEEYLLFGNGASELFPAIVRAVRPKRIVIPAPSFYGYEYAAGAAEAEVIYYALRQENGFRMAADIRAALTEETELLFLANPNNPTGTLISKEALAALLRYCAERGIYVVLDECFIEFCGGGFSMLSELAAFDHLILVRAFTKLFAIPGVRLGYLVCANRALLAGIARQLPEWNLSCFAQEAGCACAGQADFIQETERYVETQRQLLETGLRQKGFQVFPSRANFILLYTEMPLYERLLERGILIRDCRNFRGLGRGFYRIAVRSREENERLLESL
ncbi:MAG: aminotransferase class I/II-fold pyridoxal phosphate-dependent enzyme [Roseburia sp.]|nr:aminotransferase class I/II-fold pyridoxal phosphate-dependent enzyme [Roseburia sp.]